MRPLTLAIFLLFTSCGPAHRSNGSDRPHQRVENYGVIHPQTGPRDAQWIKESITLHAGLVQQFLGHDPAYPKAALIVLHPDNMALNDALFQLNLRQPNNWPSVHHTHGFIWDDEIHLEILDPKLTLGGLTEMLLHHNIGDPGHQHQDWPQWWGAEWALMSQIDQAR